MIQKAYKVHNQDGSVIPNSEIVWTTTAGEISPDGVLSIERDTFAKGGNVIATIPSYGKTVELEFGLIPDNYADGLTMCDSNGTPFESEVALSTPNGGDFTAQLMCKTSDGRYLYHDGVTWYTDGGEITPDGTLRITREAILRGGCTVSVRSKVQPSLVSTVKFTFSGGFKVYYGNGFEVPTSGLDLPRNHQNKPTDILFHCNYNGVPLNIDELIWSTTIGRVENNVLHLETSEPQTSGVITVHMTTKVAASMEFAVGYTVKGLNDPWGFAGGAGIYEMENADENGLSFLLHIPAVGNILESNPTIPQNVTTITPIPGETIRYSTKMNYFEMLIMNAQYIGCTRDDFELYCDSARVLPDFVIETPNNNRFITMTVKLIGYLGGKNYQAHTVTYNWNWKRVSITGAAYVGNSILVTFEAGGYNILDKIRFECALGKIVGYDHTVFTIQPYFKGSRFLLCQAENGRAFTFITINNANNTIDIGGGVKIPITGTPPSDGDINSGADVNPWQPGGGDDAIIGGNGNGNNPDQPDIDNTEKPPTGGDGDNSGGSSGDSGTTNPDDEITDIVVDSPYIPTKNEIIGKGRLICLKERPDCIIGVTNFDPFDGKNYRRLLPNILAIGIPERRGEDYDITIDINRVDNYDPLELIPVHFNMNGNCYEINSDSYSGVKVGNVSKNEDGTYTLTIPPVYVHELGSIQVNAMIDGYMQRTMYGIPIFFYSENDSTNDIAEKFMYHAKNVCDFAKSVLEDYVERIPSR